MASAEAQDVDGGRPLSPRLIPVLLALALNGAYLLALLHQQVAAATLLVLFWVENALGVISHHTLAEAHWRRTRDRAHYSEVRVNGKPRQMRHAAQFLIGAGAFLLMHGLMVLALAFLPFEGFAHDPRWRADWSDIGVGGLLLIGFALVAWIQDHRRLQTVPEVERHGAYHFARTLGLQVIIIFGMMSMSWLGPLGMILTVVAVKTLIDVGVALASGEAVAAERKAPTASPGGMTSSAPRRSKRRKR